MKSSAEIAAHPWARGLARLAARTSVVLGFVVLLATAHVPAQAEGPQAKDRVEAPVERYRIIGRPRSDGCAGRVYLAGRVLTVDRSAGTVFVDVVRRTYGARFPAEGGLDASGHFAADGTCEGGLDERFELRPDGADRLRGTLSSTWRFMPDCAECTIRFSIQAVRIR
jgi:hypothetical protein